MLRDHNEMIERRNEESTERGYDGTRERQNNRYYLGPIQKPGLTVSRLEEGTLGVGIVGACSQVLEFDREANRNLLMAFFRLGRRMLRPVPS